VAAAMHHGTRLEADGQVLLAADAPCHMTLSLGERQVTATTATAHKARATFYCPHKPKSVTMDGKRVPFTYDAGTRCATVTVEGDHTIRVSL
jgi:hypothetical protein